MRVNHSLCFSRLTWPGPCDHHTGGGILLPLGRDRPISPLGAGGSVALPWHSIRLHHGAADYLDRARCGGEIVLCYGIREKAVTFSDSCRIIKTPTLFFQFCSSRILMIPTGSSASDIGRHFVVASHNRKSYSARRMDEWKVKRNVICASDMVYRGRAVGTNG